MMTTACSTIDKDAPISHIDVQFRGKNIDDRPQMASVCKGFYLSEQQVRDFYFNAAQIKDDDARESYELLPCYSQGTAYLYGEKYNWIIRAGGIGEFYNKHDRFVKICGINCCDKVKRIC
jgi:hypothetical protein